MTIWEIEIVGYIRTRMEDCVLMDQLNRRRKKKNRKKHSLLTICSIKPLEMRPLLL